MGRGGEDRGRRRREERKKEARREGKKGREERRKWGSHNTRWVGLRSIYL